MKSVVPSALLAFLLGAQAFLSKATTYTIEAGDFQFTQNFDTVTVGDTIKWVWINGNHTTTSNGIPAGAQPWSVELNQFNTSFTYVVKYGGTYNYISVPDAPLMGGSFGAVYPVGISSVSIPAYNFSISGNPSRSSIHFSFGLSKASVVDISLYNLAGNRVQQLYYGLLSDGFYQQTSPLQSSLAPGLYFVTLRIGPGVVTKTVVIQ
jgi:plastocyanin